MLAITTHNKLLKEAMDKYGSIQNMTDFLAEWMQKSFGMSATMPDIKKSDMNVDMKVCLGEGDEMDIALEFVEMMESASTEEVVHDNTDIKLEHPSTYNCSDKFVQENPTLDVHNCFKNLQMHSCNLFCMRPRKIL